jgi:hypothetical protein
MAVGFDVHCSKRTHADWPRRGVGGEEFLGNGKRLRAGLRVSVSTMDGVAKWAWMEVRETQAPGRRLGIRVGDHSHGAPSAVTLDGAVPGSAYRTHHPALAQPVAPRGRHRQCHPAVGVIAAGKPLPSTIRLGSLFAGPLA